MGNVSTVFPSLIYFTHLHGVLFTLVGENIIYEIVNVNNIFLKLLSTVLCIFSLIVRTKFKCAQELKLNV